MTNAYKQIAQRIVNAENNFIELVMNAGKCSKDEAEKVFNLYRKEKFIKLDAVGGTYKVKHGQFWDYEVLQRAIAMA